MSPARQRVQHRGLRPHRRERLPARRGPPALDVLDRRRHRVVRERPALPERRRAAAARTRCASKSWSTTSTSPIRRREARRAVLGDDGGRRAARGTPKHRLALVGLQTRPIEAGRTPPRNLVFLLDVSGSMDEPDKLPLVKTAMRHAGRHARRADDRVAIVVYAGRQRAGAAVDAWRPQGRQIKQAIEELSAGGSTNGAAGHPAGLRHRRGALHQGRHQPRDPRDRRRLQRRRHQPGRSDAADRRRSARAASSSPSSASAPATSRTRRWRSWPTRGNGNYAYLDSVHGSAARAGRRGRRHAGDRRQGREDPDRVQPEGGRRLSADRLREPAAGQ